MVRSTLRRTIRDFWQFYRQYTHTAVHTAATASLAIFGLLVFVDPLFVLVAVASYVVPPIVLFAIGWSLEPERENERASGSDAQRDPFESSGRHGDGRSDSDPSAEAGYDVADRDTDSEDGDSDTDSDDGDADTDSEEGDADTDSEDGDSDTDT